MKTLQVDLKTARNIGQRLAIKSAFIGLFMAYTIFGMLMYSFDMKLWKAIFWILDVEFWYHLVLGAVGLLAMAYFFWGRAGIEILMKKRNEFLTGIKYGILVLFGGTLIGSSVGFLEEGIDNIDGFDNPFYDYYFKPLYWIAIFGTLPVLIVGIWFGHRIKNEGRKLESGGIPGLND